MRCHDIIFLAAFGDEYRVVKIASPNGSGGNTYHLMIDNHYKGVIVNRMKWEVVFQLYTDEYTSADYDILIEMITSRTY